MDKHVISPIEFIDRMESHWIGLGNAPSQALRQAWLQIGEAFCQHTLDHDDERRRTRWTVLQPATGSGKSQGTAIYAAMLARYQTTEDHPGMLIVTSRTSDVDEMARLINELAERESYATAFHSKLAPEARPALATLSSYPVLVITHKAYENALDYLGPDATIDSTWPFFHRWGGEWRRLVVIDECLAPLEVANVDLERLRATLGAIPDDIRNDDQYTSPIAALHAVVDLLEAIRGDSHHAERMMVEFIGEYGQWNVSGLRSAMKQVRWDHVHVHHDDPQVLSKLRDAHDKTLENFELLCRSWSFYSKKGIKHTLNTARLLVPDHVKGAVVLDATAQSNVIYDLFDHADVRRPPPSVRHYGNVTLYVSQGHAVGKAMETDLGALLIPALADLQKRLGDRAALVITHKGVEPHVRHHQPEGMALQTAHWGAVTGSNEWKDLDTVVVLGIPRRPDQWATSAFMALQGPQTTDWLRSSEKPFGDHKDIKQALLVGQTVSDLVQGINRIRCRKVIDGLGNCPPCGVYLALGIGEQADQILRGLTDQMPGITVKTWGLDVGRVPVKRGPKGTLLKQAIDAVMIYLDNMDRGVVNKQLLRQALPELTMKAWDSLVKQAKDLESEVAQGLAAMGVRFEHAGVGRSSCFVKP